MPVMQTNQTAELNLLWGSLLLEELSRLGVEHICMAPGSRSTPLTVAAANHPRIKQHIHFDERGLGFFALGLAKASHSPIAIITTSGTAVANLYPAIIEAWLTHVPLIILSGDRPDELIGCGANQAILQPSIFAAYAAQMNLPSPSLDMPIQSVLSELDQKVSGLTRPLHINCMYREPLYCESLQLNELFGKFQDYLAPLAKWREQTHPYIQHRQTLTSSYPTESELTQFSRGKGIIIAGTLSPEESPQAIIALAQKLGWPILADAQSQLRQHPDVIHYADQLLLKPAAKALLMQAEHLIVFGGRLLSKRMIAFIASQQWQDHWQILKHDERLDPSHSPKQVWQAPLPKLCQLEWPKSAQAGWAKDLVEHNQQLDTLFAQQIDKGQFGEAQTIRTLCQSQVDDSQLFIGNSLPIRLFDMFSPKGQCPNIYTNRGASGIDGLLATACGVAEHSKAPTSLIIGDISALHDLNSLALASQMTSPFVIVILNNDGGNIFNLLPVPNETIRQDYYRLSHGLEFGYGAAMFNLNYNRIEAEESDIEDDGLVAIDEFKEVYTSALSYSGTSVIEVCVAKQQASEQISALAQWIKQS